MKRILLLIAIVLCLANTAHAFQIETTDQHSYEFLNGEKRSDGYKHTATYEVDVDGGFIACKGQETEVYAILHAEDGNITGYRQSSVGEELFVINNDGTYCLFLTLFVPDEMMGIKGFFTNLFFGTYTVLRHDDA